MTPSPERLPHELDPLAQTCRAIVETPYGSRAKFTFDRALGLFELSKLLPLGLTFPFDFGFIPSTLGGDGDPLDILILNEVECAVGCIVKARLLGVMKADQRKDGGPAVRNDRIIARLEESRAFATVTDVEHLSDTFKSELGRFFQTYKALRAQTYEILGIGGPAEAVALIEQSTTEIAEGKNITAGRFHAAIRSSVCGKSARGCMLKAVRLNQG